MQHRVASRISIGVAVPPPAFANRHRLAHEDVITTPFIREGVDVDDTVPVELFSQPYERVEIEAAPAPRPQPRLELEADSRAYERLDVDYEIEIDIDLGAANETTSIENEIDTVNETKDDLELAIAYGLDANPSYFAAREPDANPSYTAASEPDASASYEPDANPSFITASESEPDANPSYFAASAADLSAARPHTALRVAVAFSMLGAAFGLGLGIAFLVAS